MAQPPVLQQLYDTVDNIFKDEKAATWALDNWKFPVVSCVIYLVLLPLGKKVMANRAPYQLRGLLTLWNIILAVFSILGAFAITPPLLSNLRKGGFSYSVCNSPIRHEPWLAFWSTLFCISKVIEFGDTFFIIVRKTPLPFLHWYHHVTVCLYGWQTLAFWSAPAHFFCAMNFTVHSVMYSYYALKSSRIPMPSFVAISITFLQLVQFAVGLAVIVTAAVQFWSGNSCSVTQPVIVCGLIVYGSYLVLFTDFFIKKYCSKRSPHKKVD